MKMIWRKLSTIYLILALFIHCTPQLERNILDYYQASSFLKNLLSTDRNFSFYYPENVKALSVGVAIVINPITNKPIVSCTTSTLPLGLLINSQCGIFGSPSAPSPYTSYAIQGWDGNSYFTTSLTLGVFGNTLTALSYPASSYIFTVNTLILEIIPTFSGTITNCTVTPALPAGLTINPNNCSISGTPTTTQIATNHLITASNSLGSTTATINIQVNPFVF